MKSVKSFWATIYVGSYNKDTQRYISEKEVKKSIQDYVDRAGLCVTITPTEFIYTNGSEHGWCIGLINYPRFPARRAKIRTRALEIARELMEICEQYKVSVVFPDSTVMLGREDQAIG